MRDINVIPDKEIARQHHLLVYDFRADIPPPAKKKFVPRPRIWCLKELQVQSEYQKAFIIETTSSNASGSGTEKIWEKLKSSLLKAAGNVCGSIKEDRWRRETRWWNVDSAVKEARGCCKALKNGDSNDEYQKAKRLATYPVYLAKSQDKPEAPQDPSPYSSDLFRLANKMRGGNLDIQVEKPVRNDAGELCLDDRAKQAAWKEHNERLSNVEFDWNPEPLTEVYLLEVGVHQGSCLDPVVFTTVLEALWH